MIVDRILQIVDYKGISRNKFYTLTGLSNGFLDKKKDVRSSALVKVLDFCPEINSLWLIKGEGNMFKNSFSTVDEKIINGDNNVTQLGDKNNVGDNNSVQGATKEYQELKFKVERLQVENTKLYEELLKKNEELLKSKDVIISLLNQEK